MFLRGTRLWLRERNALYSPSSSLPMDFYRCCSDYFKVVSHVPTYIGQRDSQVRGLFLSTEQSFIGRSEKDLDGDGNSGSINGKKKDGITSRSPRISSSLSTSPSSLSPRVVEANSPIFTVPLERTYTTSNIATMPNTLPHITIEQIRSLIPIDEFKLLSPQLYLGVQFAALTSAIPDVSVLSSCSASPTSSSFFRSQDEEVIPLSSSKEKMTAQVSLHRYRDLQKSHANPWLRVIEDEDLNENFILRMYGGALDKWQRESFDDLTSKFHRSITAIHEGLNLQRLMKVDHLRRISRLVLARIEHIPPENYLSSPRWQRRLSRAWRKLRRQREPFELAMIPLLDLVNHSNRPNCGVRVGPSPFLGGKLGITLYSLTRILPGQELCRHYNFSLSRSVALFRYGFLPFDLISIVDLDPANEYLFKNQNQLRPPEEAQRLKEEKEQKEVARLENLFQTAKRSGSNVMSSPY